jgi:cyanate permease
VMNWTMLMFLFRCTVCETFLEHVSSYEHDDRPYCHLDYHEVCMMRVTGTFLISSSFSSSHPDAFIVKLRLWRNTSSLWMMICWARGPIMSSISSAPSAEIPSWRQSRKDRHGFYQTECWRVSIYFGLSDLVVYSSD